MSFQRYPTYKDSGVEWLGEVPWHWNVKRLRYVINIRKGKLPAETNQSQLASDDLPYLSMEFLRGDTVTPQYVPKSPSLLCVEDGDVLLLWDGSNAGEFLRAKRGVVSSTIAHLSGINVDRDFLFYSCKAIQHGLKENTIGMGIPHVSGEELRSHSIVIPNLVEQAQIAAFLDRETAKIDALVAEQRRLMALLKEKRQAVISHAVTRGLNPHAPMKPSSIKWLGDVPEHWEVRKLNAIARLESGHTPSRQRPEYWIVEDCVIPWFTLADVGFLRDHRNIFIQSTSQKISQLGIENSSARLLPSGTVILSRTASVGFSGITKIALAVSQDFAAWICSSVISPRYLLSCLRAMKPEFQRLMMGSTHQTIYMPDIEAFRVPVPPGPEQLDIAEFVEIESTKFDNLTTEAQRAIDLLQERRTALISAAITGQIDVRNAVTAKKSEPPPSHSEESSCRFTK